MDGESCGLDSLEITIDAVDRDLVAGFWVEALRYERLYERGPYIVLGSRDPGWPRVVVQRVAARSGVKSPVHLDLRVRDVVAEVDRLVGLGGRVEGVVEEAGRGWTVMGDPEGTVFCVCPARSDPAPGDTRLP